MTVKKTKAGLFSNVVYERQDEGYKYLRSSPFFAMSRGEFSVQNLSDVCKGLHSRIPDFSSAMYSPNELHTSYTTTIGDEGARGGTCPPPKKKKIGKNIFRAIIM